MVPAADLETQPVFHTDADRILFLLESEAKLAEFFERGELSAEARDEERPKYIANFIGVNRCLTADHQ